MNAEPGHPPLWAWMVQGPDGRWGILGAALPDLGIGWAQLVAGSEQTILTFRPIAEQHRAETGERVRLVRFDGVRTVEEIQPPN